MNVYLKVIGVRTLNEEYEKFHLQRPGWRPVYIIVGRTKHKDLFVKLMDCLRDENPIKSEDVEFLFQKQEEINDEKNNS